MLEIYGYVYINLNMKGWQILGRVDWNRCDFVSGLWGHMGLFIVKGKSFRGVVFVSEGV